MHIQRVKVLRRTTALGSTHCGQYRFDQLLAKDQQRRQRADAWSAHPVPPCFTDPLHKRLAPHLAQVITRFAIPIAHHRSSLLRLHSLGQICGSEALGLCPSAITASATARIRGFCRSTPAVRRTPRTLGAAKASSCWPSTKLKCAACTTPKMPPPSLAGVPTCQAVSPAASHNATPRCC